MSVAFWGLGLVVLSGGAKGVSFTRPAEEVEAFDFVEVQVEVRDPPPGNPFLEAAVEGRFQIEGGEPVRAEGFCDSEDGSVHRIRFLPRMPGRYDYTAQYRRGEVQAAASGSFRARDGKRGGPVRVDPEHPWHFIREGTGQHYFWNSTTTYWLLGWDEETICASLDRLQSLKVNRIRVTLNGRVEDGREWHENVFPTGKFAFRLNPWPARRPDSIADPGFDVTRFNLPHWRKCERFLRRARDLDINVSLIFYLDGNKPGMDPFGKADQGGEDERRYYRYAAARLSAFSNVMWDLSNEYRNLRDEAWVDRMGAFLKEHDPCRHLASVHGYEDFRFRGSPWADFAMYQSWDEGGGYRFMLGNRRAQAAAGRPMPQVNEEYGYEDHYPPWGGNRKSPARSADNRRRLAWEISMAGCYQTTGERADRGTGWGPDTGGGWINGRGDDTMVMLEGYGRMVDFFTGFEWWRAEPRSDLCEGNALCLAEPGKAYALYLPAGGTAALKLEPGTYRARRYDPRSGETTALAEAGGGRWASPAVPAGKDWAFLLTRSAGPLGYIRRLPPESEADRALRHRKVAERRAGPVVMVHRGAASFAPENTLEAYAAALDHGADGCEVDLRRTRDGVLVLFHDDMLDRLTNGFGTVSGITYGELLSLKPQAVHGSADGTTRPPTFAALLELARRRAMLLHLDVKEPGLEEDIEALLDEADAWDHLVSVNAPNAPRLSRHPRLKPLAYRGPGLFDDRLDMDPQAVRDFLARPGQMVIVDDPRVAARELGRRSVAPVPLPAGLRLEWPAGPAPPDASPGELVAVLERDDPERMEPQEDPERERRRTERILERARAAQRLGELGRKSPRLVELLELQVKRRSLHRDWIHHGLDGAMAARALGRLGAVESAPVLVEAFRRVDPALARVADPAYRQYPLSWTDYRAKMTIIPALGDLPSPAAKEFLAWYVALSAEEARALGPPQLEEAVRALFRQELAPPEIEALLRSPRTAVRGTAVLECLDHPTPQQTTALRSAAAWALELK